MKVQFDKILFIQRLQADHFEVEFPQFIDPQTEKPAVLRILLSDIGDDQNLYNQTIADHIRELMEESLIKGRPLKQISQAEMQKYEVAEINNQLARGELEIGIQVQMKLALLKASEYYAGTEVVNVAKRQYSIQYLTQPNSTLDVDLWSQLMLAMGVVPKLSLEFRAPADDGEVETPSNKVSATSAKRADEPSDDRLVKDLMDSLKESVDVPRNDIAKVPAEGTPVGDIINHPERYGNPMSAGKSTIGLDNLCKQFEDLTIYEIGSIDLRRGLIAFMSNGVTRTVLSLPEGAIWKQDSTLARVILVKHIWSTMPASVYKEYQGAIPITALPGELEEQYSQGMRVEGLSDDLRALGILRELLILGSGDGGVMDLRLQGVIFYSGGERKDDLNIVKMRLHFHRPDDVMENGVNTIIPFDDSRTWIELRDPVVMAEINRLANMAMADKPVENQV